MTYSAIGHSHLDLLFLWPERETWRKCARTLSTVVKMMDRFPEYRFCLSQARQKKWNRRLEQALHTLEWLASLALAKLGEPYPDKWLQQCWQDVMLYQFHDCLPGSAIRRVYEETQARYEELYRQAREQIETLKEKLAGCLELRGMKEPMTVFNPVSFRRTERLEWEGRELTVTLEPFEILAADGASAEPEEVKARQEQAVRFG